MNPTSSDVRVFGTDTYSTRAGTRYRVRWQVEGKRFSRAYTTRKAADVFRSSLLSAHTKGVPFDTGTGLPFDPTRVTRPATTTWLELAVAYVEHKWGSASPRHRKGMAEALTNVTLLLIDTSAGPLASYSRPDITTALTYGAFSRSNARAFDEELLAALHEAAPDASTLGDPILAQRLLDSLAVRQDGRPAAKATLVRKRATLHNVLQYAVHKKLIPLNPLTSMTASSSSSRRRVDPRTLINREQGDALLAALRQRQPHLRAYFALMLLAGLRPAEARNVRCTDLTLPEEGWGRVVLHSSAQVSGSAWTDDGSPSEQRPLKHRELSDIRSVPLSQEAVKVLREHLESWPSGPDGHLFVSRTGKAGKPLKPPYTALVSLETLGRAWARARVEALTPEQVASPLARRPYDLRHARLTWWLNAGVSPTQVAQWAGHSVRVLLDVYAGCVDGEEQRAMKLLEAAEQSGATQDP